MKASTCACTAATTRGALAPTVVTAMPEPRSMRWLPSTSTTMPPSARAAKTGIVVPTPPATAEVLRAISARERGPGTGVTRARCCVTVVAGRGVACVSVAVTGCSSSAGSAKSPERRPMLSNTCCSLLQNSEAWMELRHLRYFVATAEAGTVSAAAGAPAPHATRALAPAAPAGARPRGGAVRAVRWPPDGLPHRRALLPLAQDLLAPSGRAAGGGHVPRPRPPRRLTIGAPTVTLTDVVSPFIATLEPEDPTTDVLGADGLSPVETLLRGADLAIGTVRPQAPYRSPRAGRAAGVGLRALRASMGDSATGHAGGAAGGAPDRPAGHVHRPAGPRGRRRGGGGDLRVDGGGGQRDGRPGPRGRGAGRRRGLGRCALRARAVGGRRR